MNRDFKGIWIPKEIWLNEELTVMEKLFLVEIDSLDNEENCYASNEHFAKFFKLSKNRCSEIIKSLEKKQLISIEYLYKDNSKEIDKRVIKVLHGVAKCVRNIEGGIRNIDRGYSEKCEDNNTLFNNTNIYSANNDNIKNDKDFIDEIWNLYPSKTGKQISYKKIPLIVKKIGKEKLIQAINNYKETVEQNRKTGFNQQYMNGSTFFNGRYEDYLEIIKPKEIQTQNVNRESSQPKLNDDILKMLENEFN